MRFHRGLQNGKSRSKYGNVGSNMTVEEYGNLMEELDRACASPVSEKKVESGDDFEKYLWGDEKWGWL